MGTLSSTYSLCIRLITWCLFRSLMRRANPSKARLQVGTKRVQPSTSLGWGSTVESVCCTALFCLSSVYLSARVDPGKYVIHSGTRLVDAGYTGYDGKEIKVSWLEKVRTVQMMTVFLFSSSTTFKLQLATKVTSNGLRSPVPSTSSMSWQAAVYRSSMRFRILFRRQ